MPKNPLTNYIPTRYLDTMQNNVLNICIQIPNKCRILSVEKFYEVPTTKLKFTLELKNHTFVHRGCTYYLEQPAKVDFYDSARKVIGKDMGCCGESIDEETENTIVTRLTGRECDCMLYPIEVDNYGTMHLWIVLLISANGDAPGPFATKAPYAGIIRAVPKKN